MARILIVGLLLLASAAGLAAHFAPWLESRWRHVQARRLLREASERHWRRDLLGAADRYQRALDHDPGLSRVHLYLGDCYEGLDQPSLRGRPAAEDLRRLAVRHYTLAAGETRDAWARLTALTRLAALAADESDPLRLAETPLRQLAAHELGEASHAFALARVLERTGRPAEAREALRAAALRWRQDPNVAREQALLAARQERFGDADEALRRWALLAPADAEPRVQLAALLWDRAFRELRLDASERLSHARHGLEAAEAALRLDETRRDARSYRELLAELCARLEAEATPAPEPDATPTGR